MPWNSIFCSSSSYDHHDDDHHHLLTIITISSNQDDLWLSLPGTFFPLHQPFTSLWWLFSFLDEDEDEDEVLIFNLFHPQGLRVYNMMVEDEDDDDDKGERFNPQVTTNLIYMMTPWSKVFPTVYLLPSRLQNVHFHFPFEKLQVYFVTWNLFFISNFFHFDC